MTKLKTKYAILIVLGVLLLGCFIGWFLQRNGVKQGEFVWKNGENEITLKLDQEQINEEVLLTQIFSEEWTKNASTSWLQKNYNLFHYKEPSLSKSIETLSVKEDLSKNLRELSRKRLGPWAYNITEIEIGYPEKPPVEGKAFACETGDYYREKVKLITLNGKKEVIVEVTGSYQCPEKVSYPEMQISKADKEKLFGNTPFSKTEKVFALIIDD